MPSFQETLASSAPVAPGSAWLGFLGQHGFVMRFGAARIVVDAFLSDHRNRIVAAPAAAADLATADLVCATHEHRDHLDLPLWKTLIGLSSTVRFAAPARLFPALADDLGLPPERLFPMTDGTVVEAAGVRVTGVPAAHETIDVDDAGRHRWLGYVVEAGGVAVYHAGDTCLYPGMARRLAEWKLSAALLPVNGRNEERHARNIIGNMDTDEAAQLACELRPGLVAPTHFDLMRGNGADPAEFTRAMAKRCPDIPVWIPVAGTGRTITAR